MMFGVSIFVAVFMLVIFAVIFARSRYQDRSRLKILTEVAGDEPAQEASKSPIQTGAPLNSHSLPFSNLMGKIQMVQMATGFCPLTSS